MVEIINQKPLSLIQKEKEKEIANVTADMWEAISQMGADIVGLQMVNEELKKELAKKGGGLNA